MTSGYSYVIDIQQQSVHVEGKETTWNPYYSRTVCMMMITIPPYNFSTSMARKCSLLTRPSGPDTDIVPADTPPQGISNEQGENVAIRAFYYKYCITSIEQSLSLGCMGGLEPMLNQLGGQTDFAKAYKEVASASHTIKLHWSSFMQKAELLYHELLGSLARAIEHAALAKTGECVMIETVLGLYKICSSWERSIGMTKLQRPRQRCCCHPARWEIAYKPL